MDINTIKKGLKELREQAKIISESEDGGGNFVIVSMLWCLLRYGARPIDYVRFGFYTKNHRGRNRYLTIYRYLKMLKYFGASNQSTNGKIAEYQTFANYIHRPWMTTEKGTDPKIIKDFIAQNGVIFAKPNHGDQGKGVMKIKSEDSKAIEELIEECKKRKYVIEGAIKQSAEIARINPSSVNTVRAYTLLKRNGETQILEIMLRVGRKGSHVDNWGSGGIGYNFEVETGICVGYGRDKQNNPYVFHPDSNIQMVGYKLPDFDKLKAAIIEMSQLVPAAKFVGWDIAITENGYELVEMNCPGGHDFLQAFGKPYGDILKRELI